MIVTRAVGSAIFVLALTSVHCSSSSSSGGGSDAGADAAPADASSGDAAMDSGQAAVNGCGTNDFVSASDPTAMRVITFPTAASAAQFSPHCMKIKVGQSVTWNGAFNFHPLEPMGGDTPSPIMATSTGTTVTFAFSTAGTFGFDCANHPSIMHGAILVVP